MAPDGESAAFASLSPKAARWSPNRERSHSDNSRSWPGHASLRKTHSADADDVEQLSCSSPMSAVHSLGVGRVSRNGSKVDRFRSSQKKTSRQPLHLWPLGSSPRGIKTQDGSNVSPSSSEHHSLMSIMGESTMSYGAPPANGLMPTSWLKSIKDSHESIQPVVAFRRRHSSFLRVADLPFSELHLLGFDANDDEELANFSYPATDPPPGVTWDPEERWVALDNGAGSHAPVAPAAIAALAKFGLELCLKRESIWTPDNKTMKILKSVGKTTTQWQAAWQHGLPIVKLPPIGSMEEKDVLVWSASSLRGSGYGSDIPAVRVMGILNLSPRALTEWLIDSSRVQEYNKMSLGRSDVLVLHNDLDGDGPFGKSVTKVMKSQTRPPLLRKTMQFISLLHARALEAGPLAGGFIIVTRAVTPAAEDEDPSEDLLQSEIMTGVNLMLPVQDDPNRCLMINISHIKSPMVPMMLAKRIGLTAAANFIQDLRACAAAAAQR